MKIVLILALLLVPALAACGDRICSSGEGRATCPVDCCLVGSDGVCRWYSECGNYDPDCCTGACYQERYVCTSNEKGADCYPSACSSGVCGSTCTSFTNCPSGFCSTQCSLFCIGNGNSAADFGSCCECYSAGTCQQCSGISVRGTGFFVYRDTAISIPVQLYNSSSVIDDLEVSVSGPLRDYLTLYSNDQTWTGSGFEYMNPNEIKIFYATLDDIPADMYGVYQIKFSIIYDGGSASHLVWVAAFPVSVMEQGREPPAKGSVGISRIVKKMAHGNTTLPVEVIMQLW